MSIDLGIYTEKPPTSWDDGLDWSINAKPTLRHIQAILCAVGERATLTSGAYGNSLLFDLPYASTITIEMLTLLTEKIYKYLPPSFDYTNPWLGNLNRNEYFFSLGKEYLNFDSKFAFWWDTEIDKYAIYGRWYDENAGRFANYVTSRELSKAYFSKEVATKAHFIKCSHLDNKAIMQWLNEIKDEINKLHSIVVFPSTFSVSESNTPFPLTRSCWLSYEEYSNGNTRGDKELHYTFSAENWGSKNWDSGYGYAGEIITGFYNCYEEPARGGGYNRYWDYEYNCLTSPYKVVNKGDISFKLSAHFWQFAYEEIYKINEEDDNVVDSIIEKFLDFLPIENFPVKGWNDFGTIDPAKEVQIFTPNMCSNIWEKYPLFEAFDPTYKYIDFAMGVDAFMLDFRVDGGFKFI